MTTDLTQAAQRAAERIPCCHGGDAISEWAHVIAEEFSPLAQQFEAAQAEAAAMRECLSLLPDGRCGGKTGRADYHAGVGGDVLLKCTQTLLSGTAGQAILDRIKAAEGDRDCYRENWDKAEATIKTQAAEIERLREGAGRLKRQAWLERFSTASETNGFSKLSPFSANYIAREINYLLELILAASIPPKPDTPSTAKQADKPFPRFFRHAAGLVDGEYIRFDSHTDGYWVSADHSERNKTSSTYAAAMSFVSGGQWEEIADPRTDRIADAFRTAAGVETETPVAAGVDRIADLERQLADASRKIEALKANGMQQMVRAAVEGNDALLNELYGSEPLRNSVHRLAELLKQPRPGSKEVTVAVADADARHEDSEYLGLVCAKLKLARKEIKRLNKQVKGAK